MSVPWHQPLLIDSAPEGTDRRIRVGELALRLQATPKLVSVQMVVEGRGVSEPVRYLRAPTATDLMLTALPADRSVVARPSQPLVVMGSGRAAIYVSSPVWVGLVAVGGVPFVEFPTTTPKQTWSGATPQAGHVAYATRTRARVDLDNVEHDEGRVTTCVELVNPMPDAWHLERIEVPLPHLPLYRAADGRLWTSSVRVERSTELVVDAQVLAGPPDVAGACERLAPPRLATTPRLSLLALGRWRWP